MNRCYRTLVLLFVLTARLEAAVAADAVDFARDIQPILRDNCEKCHGPGKQKGGLRLDSVAAARQGGYSGAAVEPGKSAKSPLIQRITGMGDGPAMPPGNKRLSPAYIALLRA